MLNTGALKLAATLPSGDPLAEGSVRFDIFSDEEDQFGNRHRILANAKPDVVIRLNAGAYHIVSLYGDANASVKCDVTVEPGKTHRGNGQADRRQGHLQAGADLGGRGPGRYQMEDPHLRRRRGEGECRRAADPYPRQRQLRRSRRPWRRELHAEVLDRVRASRSRSRSWSRTARRRPRPSSSCSIRRRRRRRRHPRAARSPATARPPAIQASASTASRQAGRPIQTPRSSIPARCSAPRADGHLLPGISHFPGAGAISLSQARGARRGQQAFISKPGEIEKAVFDLCVGDDLA